MLTLQSALIPSGVSSECQAVLNEVDSDSSIQSCVNGLVKATNSFSPLSGKKGSASEVESTLGGVCSANGSCDESAVRGILDKFYNACSAELESNKDIAALYDTLYVFTPLRQAVCTKDSATGKYCVSRIGATGGSKNSVSAIASSALDLATNYGFSLFGGHSKRAVEPTVSSIITPNATTYASTNLPFLFLQPNMSKDQLCTPCSRSIFVTYFKWIGQTQYPSTILSGREDLWNAVTSTCDQTFVDSISKEANVHAASGAMQRVGGASAVAVAAAGLVAFYVGA